MSKEKKNKINLVVILGRIAFFTALFMLATYVTTVFLDSDKYVNTFTENNVRLASEQTVADAEQLAFRPFEELKEVADRMANVSTHDEAKAVLSEYIGSPLFGGLRYYADGNSYDSEGLLIEGTVSGKQKVDALVATHRMGCTEPYSDSTVRQDCIAFFIPVFSSEYVDGVVSVLPSRGIISLDSLMKENLSAIMLVDQTGKKLAESYVEGLLPDFSGNNAYNNFGELIHGKDTWQSLRADMQGGRKAVKTVTFTDGDYVICVNPLENFSGKLSLVSVVKTEGIIAPEMVYIRHIANISIIALILLLIGAAFAFIYYRRSRRELETVTYTNVDIGCPNGVMFKKTATERLTARDDHYAVALFELRQFRYINETLNGMKTEDFLKMVAKVFETFCSPNEAYGYLGEGRFALLISVRNGNTVKDRVHLICQVVAKNMSAADSKTKQYFNVGISGSTAGKNTTVTELMVAAEIACEQAHNNMNLPYVTFNEDVGAEKKRNERIEAEMENALATGEFRIFLQPKYNVAGDRIDSAEVLVRWFDPKTGDYRFPGEFIGLFETNGFITKLDHFIYLEALKFISETVARGDKVVPIAVNVSMVTVNSPDFLNFYIENKKKYQIGDDFIIIEFTESLTMEDFDSVRNLVDTLHRNGIRCSLDDFGSGYSSLVMLKNVPFDELKFDRSFLAKGYSTKGDDVIIGAMYELAKGLGIRVVQEGVENKETFDRIVAGGCDIVQGYYYAKAIPVEEYRLFINSNTSIKFKSRVK